MHERVQMYLQNLFLCVFAINSAVLSTLLTASFAHAPAEISGALDTFRLNSYLQNWVTLSGCDVQMSENSNCPYLHVIQCFFLGTFAIERYFFNLICFNKDQQRCSNTDTKQGQTVPSHVRGTVYTLAHWATKPLHPFHFLHVQDVSVVTHC